MACHPLPCLANCFVTPDGGGPYHDLGLLANNMVLSDASCEKRSKKEARCPNGWWVGREDREGCLGHWTAGVVREAKGCGPYRLQILISLQRCLASQTQNEFTLSPTAVSDVAMPGNSGEQPLLQPAVVIFPRFAKTMPTNVKKKIFQLHSPFSQTPCKDFIPAPNEGI